MMTPNNKPLESLDHEGLFLAQVYPRLIELSLSLLICYPIVAQMVR